MKIINKNNTDHMMKIPYKLIAALCVGYLVVPICIFLLTWIKWYIGFPAIIILLVGYISLLKNTYIDNTEIITIPIRHFFLIAIFFAFWTWTTGIGNFFVSSYDHPWRIAIFRDLINYPWPVIYPESGNALVYYLCYWLVPALFGKMFGWTVGNVCLLIWTYVGILLVFFLLIHVCHIKSTKGIWTVAILLFGWSGLNIVGSVITQILNINLYDFSLGGFEGWLDALFNGYSFNFFYRTNMNALADIYNQTTPVWIITLLILDNRHCIYNFAFLGLCLLPFAPIPFLGTMIFLLSFFIVYYIKIYRERALKKLFIELFSVQNICAIISIFPVILFFYMCNQTVAQGKGGGIMLLPFELFDKTRIVGIILFWLLQFGILTIFIFEKFKNNYIFYITIITLLLCPFIEFGKRGGRDFCMNASMPALFILMCFTIIYINENIISKVLTYNALCIIIVLLLSILSPIGRIAGQLDVIGNEKHFPIVNDTIYSLSTKDAEEYENFLVSDPMEKAFFKYFSK